MQPGRREHTGLCSQLPRASAWLSLQPNSHRTEICLIAPEEHLTSGCPETCVLHLKRKKRGNMCRGAVDKRSSAIVRTQVVHPKHDETTSSTSFSRYLLFQLSEDITEDELMSFKLLLVKELPKSKLTRETVSISCILSKNYYCNPQRQLGCSWGNKRHSSLRCHSYCENTAGKRVFLGAYGTCLCWCWAQLLQQCHSQLCQECQALRPSYPNTPRGQGTQWL